MRLNYSLLVVNNDMQEFLKESRPEEILAAVPPPTLLMHTFVFVFYLPTSLDCKIKSTRVYIDGFR
jgi:hypothetical protein